VHFGDYLKNCRIKLDYTQDDMVEKLYLFNDRLFDGLNSPTYSKWERNASQPSPHRLSEILYFIQQQNGNMALPFWQDVSDKDFEKELCHAGIVQLLGTTKTITHNLDLDILKMGNYSMMPLRHFERADELLEVHQILHEKVNPPFSRVGLDQFRKWNLDPQNFFYVLLYKNTFLGLFFALNLKPSVFDQLIAMQKRKIDLTQDDFIDPDETGSIYLLSSFSLDASVTTMLIRRLYAYLVVNQDHIKDIGLITAQSDIQRLAERMSFRHQDILSDAEMELHSYSAALQEMIRGEDFVRALFPKKSCVEA
jgi:transcriptional regulator with XRE-family HTH domain